MAKLVTADFSNNANPCIMCYITIDNQMIDLKVDSFDAEIISHIYANGEIQLIFNKPITFIGDFAFSNCTTLKSIRIPNSVTSIGRSAFVNCSCLESITIPDNVTNIGDSAFAQCSD